MKKTTPLSLHSQKDVNKKELKIEITTIPSQHVIRVMNDPETGGYEVTADLRRIKLKWQTEAFKCGFTAGVNYSKEQVKNIIAQLTHTEKS
jgi:hypothetical protein